MAEKHEIRVRIALVGPPGSGKTAALECLHRTTPADRRGPLIQIAGSTGKTLLYDHAEFSFGKVGEMPLFVDIYALPGSPAAVLARRSVLSGCDAFVFTADGRDSAMLQTRAGFQDLMDFLAEQGRSPEETALVVQLTRQDLLDEGGGSQVKAALEGAVGPERVVSVSTKTGAGVNDAIKKTMALALALERDEIEARRRGGAPPRVHIPPKLEQDVELAQRVYAMAKAQAEDGQVLSPHGDVFFGRILLELGAVSQENLEEGLRLCAQAYKLNLRVTLEDVLTKREMLDLQRLPRAHMVRACVEVIHEELLFAKVANELELVPFARIKQALTLQARRSFHYSLDHLLYRAGHIDRMARRQIMIRMLQTHQAELMRDEQDHMTDHGPLDTAPFENMPRTGRWNAVPLFGEIALSLELVTKQQLNECLKEQAALKKDGKRRFLGAIMRQKGYLAESDLRRVCKALEDKISDDRIQGYTILDRLGRGNMALVFAARQESLDRIVALKLLDPKLLFDADFIDRFQIEAKAAARLNHPNIVQAYDVGSDQELHYFAMEYVDGLTVREFMDENGGKCDEDMACDVILQVARALDHAAAHNLVHRDVKPGNVMITRTGVVKLCDLGLAKTLDADAPGSEEAVILGSPYYISPEQIEGRADLDVRADLYSLGAMFFHMVTGRPPFLGRTPEDVCIKHLSEPVPDPADLSSTATTRITPIIFKMMQKDRRDRFKTCSELVRAILGVKPEAGNDLRQLELSELVAPLIPKRDWLA